MNYELYVPIRMSLFFSILLYLFLLCILTVHCISFSGNNIGGAAWNTTQDQQAILMQQMYANYMTQYVQYLQVNLFLIKVKIFSEGHENSSHLPLPFEFS